MTREQILANGVRNLQQFGYPGVNEQNILTDLVYSMFFQRLLEDNLGKGADDVIKPLMKEIKPQEEKAAPAKAEQATSPNNRQQGSKQPRKIKNGKAVASRPKPPRK